MNGGGLPLGLGHETHPLIGSPVRDTEHDAVGILQAVTAEIERTGSGGERTVRTAWLRPSHGGTEWETPLDAIQPEAAGADA